MTLDDILEHYGAYGYVVVPGLLGPAEIAELRAVTDAVAATAAGLSEETPVFDFDPAEDGAPTTIQRIKKPHRVHATYAALSRHPALLAVLERFIGPDIRLSHSKINMKAGNGGAALEWHQDWAYAPHTNMDTCVISIMIDDASVANGAMQVISESHKGPLHEHHDADGYFDGAIDVATAGLDMNRAVPLEGSAGTVAFHHPLTIHGSARVIRAGYCFSNMRRPTPFPCSTASTGPNMNHAWSPAARRAMCGSCRTS
jgi:ectoine hydroxylase-related dioxygenase (phytanoyl-CoA dioxygenase family)